MHEEEQLRKSNTMEADNHKKAAQHKMHSKDHAHGTKAKKMTAEDRAVLAARTEKAYQEAELGRREKVAHKEVVGDHRNMKLEQKPREKHN